MKKTLRNNIEELMKSRGEGDYNAIANQVKYCYNYFGACDLNILLEWCEKIHYLDKFEIHGPFRFGYADTWNPSWHWALGGVYIVAEEWFISCTVHNMRGKALDRLVLDWNIMPKRPDKKFIFDGNKEPYKMNISFKESYYDKNSYEK